MLREKLAEYAHEAWSRWMRYIFSKSTVNNDGSVTIPASLVNRWTRQMDTDYHMLPNSEQQSDIQEADRMLDIINVNHTAA
jgi:hypothetical protein